MRGDARARVAVALALASAAAAAWASGTDPAARDDEALARKAARRASLEALREPPRAEAPIALPAADAGVAVQHVGALSMALSEYGGFSALARPEQERGVAPLLSLFPDTTTSRVSLFVDGEARMVAPRAGLALRGDGVQLVAREGDLEVMVVVTGGAPRVDEAALAERSRLRIEASVANRGGAPHQVGLRLLLDLIDGFEDAPAVRLGRRVELTSSDEWVGDAVPPLVAVGARELLLRGVGGHAPDRALLGPLAPFLAAPFDLPFAAGAPLAPDSALALYAEPQPLPPGAARSLAVEFVTAGGPAPAPLDAQPPVFSRAFVEPLPGSDAWRVFLSLENALNGAIGPCDQLRVDASFTPGLELLAAPDDATRLGDLPLDAAVQRSWIVRPNLASGGGQLVRFDVASGKPDARTRKTIDVGVPTPAVGWLGGRIVDVQGRPIPGADVWLERDGQRVAQALSDGGGGYGFGGVPPGPWQIRASKVIWREPAAKERREDVENLLYDVVLTSATIGNDGREQLPTVTPGGARDIALAHSLTRYSLFCCTEWDASRAYLEEIGRGMRRAAEFLHAASDGQLTFGRVVIVDCGDGWNQADLWDWACNHIHPNASVSGIRHRYDATSAPWNTAINFGRYWNGPWDAHGHYSTIVHEFGHYGLGLFDEYLGAPQGEYRGLSYPEMCRCIMGYQYADWKICWHGNHHAYTNQGMWNGRSCWQQIEEWHEGLRGGYFAPVTTPAERGGVVPPPFETRIGNELALVIRDHDSGGFDATLELAGIGSAERAGAVVHVLQAHDGRTLYQGQTGWNGTIGLMGVHVGDRVSALVEGRRAEFTVRERLDRYALEFDGGRGETLAPMPWMRVVPELAGGRDAGGAIEVAPWLPLDGAPRVRWRSGVDAGGAARDAVVELAPLAGLPGLFGAPIEEASWAGPRLSGELVLPDAVRGDATVTIDAVRAIVEADREESVASFDGALELRLPPGSVVAGERLVVASGAGPRLHVAADGTVVAPAAAAHASVGRLHALALAGAPAPFARPVALLLHAPSGSEIARLHVRRLDPSTRRFEPLAAQPGAEPDTLLAALDEPGVVALFE